MIFWFCFYPVAIHRITCTLFSIILGTYNDFKILKLLFKVLAVEK